MKGKLVFLLLFLLVMATGYAIGDYLTSFNKQMQISSQIGGQIQDHIQKHDQYLDLNDNQAVYEEDKILIQLTTDLINSDSKAFKYANDKQKDYLAARISYTNNVQGYLRNEIKAYEYSWDGNYYMMYEYKNDATRFKQACIDQSADLDQKRIAAGM